MTDAETIRELMTQYYTSMAKWIEAKGSAEGFNEWFTGQVVPNA